MPLCTPLSVRLKVPREPGFLYRDIGTEVIYYKMTNAQLRGQGVAPYPLPLCTPMAGRVKVPREPGFLYRDIGTELHMTNAQLDKGLSYTPPCVRLCLGGLGSERPRFSI